jgi:hypothetical protein
MSLSSPCGRFQRGWIQTRSATTVSLALSLLALVSLAQGSSACERHLHGHQGSQTSAQTPATTNR